LRAGLAKLCEPCVGRRPDNFNDFAEAEQFARAEKIGVWSNVVPEIRRIVDLVRSPPDSAMQQQILGKTHSGIIEAVLGGNRYRILLLEMGVEIRVGINGIWPVSGLINEERSHAQMFHLQRNCVVIANDYDHGRFLCDVTLEIDGRRVDLAEDLIRNGFAVLYHGTRKPNLIALVNRIHREFIIGIPDSVQITQIWDPITFTVQFDDHMPKINQALLGADDKINGIPQGLVAVRAGNQTFRARVLNVHETKATVEIIDFGDHAQVDVNSLSQIPPEIAHLEPQTRLVQLACVACGGDGVDEVWDMCRANQLWMFFAYQDDGDIPAVFLMDKRELKDAVSVNQELIRRGIARFERHEVSRLLEPVVAKMNLTSP
jgi:hypothetical protein